MPRFNFVSPGAAAVDELQRVLAEREAKRQQDFLNNITMQREKRNDEVQRAQMESLTEQRDVMNQGRKLEQAKSIAGMMTPTQDVDPDTAQTLREGGLGILIRPSGPAQDGETEGTVNTTDVFRGTPAQLKAKEDSQRKQEYLSKLDPNSAEAKALGYEMATGNNAPAGMFAQPSKGAAAQEYEYYADQEKKGGRTPLSFDEYQARDANRKRPKPESMTDSGMNPAQERRFNSLASERARSPLMRAADRTVVLANATKAIQANPNDPASQLALAYSWIQALDTYQSAVREGELQLMGNLATRWQGLLTEANRVVSTGAVMPPEVASQIAANAGDLIRTIEQGRMLKEREFAARAKVSGVEKPWMQFMSEAGIQMEPPQAPAAAPAAPAAKPAPTALAAPSASAAPPNADALRKKYNY
jgi:hypothetical protein